MCTGAQLDIISRQMIEAYHQIFGNDVVSIYLYGSYARGDYDSESDIDLAAIVKGERYDLQTRLKQVWDISAEIGLENDVVISPVVIPYNEFERYKTILPYYMNIVKEGHLVG